MSTHPASVIPKKNQPGRWRLIVDLSSPHGSSVNDFIDPNLSSLSYVSVDDAAAHIWKSGPGTQLAKLDISEAYRIVPVHPQDRFLLGMQWDRSCYVDCCLPFGLRSAPKLFNAVADALEWIICCHNDHMVEFVIHYLDDFLFAGEAGSSSCRRSLNLALRLCGDLGVPIMPEKVAGPSTSLEFLGLLIDTVKMEISLPIYKLTRLKAMLDSWQVRKSCSKRQLQSIIGHLHHASKVVKPGRPFIRRLIDLASSRPHPESWIRLNTDFRSDIQWWVTFLDKWNGVSIVSALYKRPVDILLTTDASGKWGCGGYLNRRWFQLPWNGLWQDMSIAVKELLPIVIACFVWRREMSGLHIRCRCDNSAVVAMVNNGTSKQKVAAHLLRCLFLLAATQQISLSACHLPGADNGAADALSRGELPRFNLYQPEAETIPTPVPKELIDCLVVSTPDWLSQSWLTSFSSLL